MARKSIEQVAREVLDSVLEKSINEVAEYGGMIYAARGEFVATRPRTQGYGNTVDVGLHDKNMGCPPETTPVATYHTHPSYSAGSLLMKYNEFSDEDKNIATDYSLDVYIGTLDGSFLKYDRKLNAVIRLKGRLKNSSK